MSVDHETIRVVTNCDFYSYSMLSIYGLSVFR